MKDQNEMIEKTKKIVSELRQNQEEYEKFELSKLEEDGLIIKKGAWYLVPDMGRVPKYFNSLITELKENSDKNGILVKVTKKKNPFSKLLKEFEKLGF